MEETLPKPERFLPRSFHDLQIICNCERRIRLLSYLLHIYPRRHLGQRERTAFTVDLEHTLHSFVSLIFYPIPMVNSPNP